ncbi:MAG: hypothetical protein ACTSSI_14640 [Candidatus Helarchaeota archaeon]
MSRIAFQKDEMTKIEEDFKKIPLDEGTMERISQMAVFFHDIFPSLTLMCTKGTILLSLKEWQMKNKIRVDDIPNLPRAKMQKAVADINVMVKERIKKLVLRKEDEAKVEEVFAEALEKALKMY